MSNLIEYHTRLSVEEAHHLQRLISEWQLVSDLLGADLTLWVSSMQIPHTMVCVAQCIPNTAISVHLTDQVGQVINSHNQIHHDALRLGRAVSRRDTQWVGPIGIRSEAIPVRYQNKTLGVMLKQVNVSLLRLPTSQEIAYYSSGGDLVHMITAGNFPSSQSESVGSDTIRVSDGFMRLDMYGVIKYASPSAVASYQRLGASGNFIGANLAQVASTLQQNSFEAEELQRLFKNIFVFNREFRRELQVRGVSLAHRIIPLTPRGQSAGAIVLIKDVTELKSKDRALLSKDAIIREIHHRVKNNLQSVSALLRLQSRRSNNEETQRYLNEAVRRISAIATVHDTLSLSAGEAVDFNDILSQLIPTLDDIRVGEKKDIRVSISGGVGLVNSHKAVPLAMAITELLQNSMEHAFTEQNKGIIGIECKKTKDILEVSIRDDGKGLPPNFSVSQKKTLGLYIVSTLVSAELSGEFSLSAIQPRGTQALLRIPLD